jgi:tRNA threonylcarbamoyladenosine biosynthesis protein TsaB
MKLLFVDTCGVMAGVAVGDGGRIVAESNLVLDRRMSTRLLAVIDGLLVEARMTVAELDGIGVACGPGSFTGVRIGMATVKGMALAAALPVVGVSSLALLAANVPFAQQQVCALMDARKKEVYAGFFRCEPLPAAVGPEWVISPERLLDTIKEPTIFVGDGASAYRELIKARCGNLARFVPFSCSHPRGACGIALSREAFRRGEGMSPERLDPVYIRASEAEVAKAEGATRWVAR